MDFYQGGLFAYDRDECCFIKYLVNIIQSIQLNLKKEQLDVNTDFEECIAAIRSFGEPQCVWVWRELRLNKLTPLWDEMFPAERNRLMQLLLKKVTLYEDHLDLDIRTAGVEQILEELDYENHD